MFVDLVSFALTSEPVSQVRLRDHSLNTKTVRLPPIENLLKSFILTGGDWHLAQIAVQA